MINIVKKYTTELEIYNKGIYLITLEHSSKSYYYVGSTKCKEGFYRRWYKHINDLKKNIHSSPKLQNIVNKYGLSIIKFSIIESVYDLENLYKKEQDWLDYYSKIGNIVNFAPIVAANTVSMTEIIKNKISKSLKGKYIGSNSTNAKNIYKYSIQGEFIKKYNSILDVCKELKSTHSNFRFINKPIFYKGFLFTRTLLTDKEIDYFKKFKACKKYWCRKPILQYDKNLNLIKEWASCEEASVHFQISSGALNQALKGKVKKCKNFIWKYSNYQNPWDSPKN